MYLLSRKSNNRKQPQKTLDLFNKHIKYLFQICSKESMLKEKKGKIVLMNEQKENQQKMETIKKKKEPIGIL